MRVTNEAEARQAGNLLVERISKLSSYHKQKNALYDGTFHTPSLEAIEPEKMGTLGVTSGWPRTVVDSIVERLSLIGFVDKNDELQDELDRLSGRLAFISRYAHTEAAKQGVGFVSVSRGDTSAGEPEVLLMAHPAESATCYVNARTGWADVAITSETDHTPDGRAVVRYYVWTHDCVYEYKTTPISDGIQHASFAASKFVSATPHDLGMCPVIPIPNDSSPSKPLGRSEITPAVKYLTESSVRTFKSLETNRGLQDSPGRYVIGAENDAAKDYEESLYTFDSDDLADMDAGIDAALGVDGDEAIPQNAPKRVVADQPKLSRWQMLTSAVWEIPLNDDGEKPTVGQFQQVSAGNQDTQMKVLGQQISAITKISPRTFGVAGTIPTSADALAIEERDLTRKALLRQQGYTPYWSMVGALILRALGATDATPERVTCRWSPITNTTFGSAVDGLLKLKSIGTIEDPQGDAALSLIGLPSSIEDLIRQERSKVSVAARTDALTEAISKIRGDASDIPPTDQGVVDEISDSGEADGL